MGDAIATSMITATARLDLCIATSRRADRLAKASAVKKPAPHPGRLKPAPTLVISFPQSEYAQREPGDRRDVLLPVDVVGDRTVDNLRPEARLPDERSGLRVERVEIALAAAREQQIRRRRQNAAVGDVGHRKAPLDVAASGVDGKDRARGRCLGAAVGRAPDN